MTPQNALAAAGRKLVLATSATPLGRIWRSGYRAVSRLAAASLARGYDATVYVRLLGALRAAVFGRLRAGDEPRPADVDGLREVVRAHLTNAPRAAFQAS